MRNNSLKELLFTPRFLLAALLLVPLISCGIREASIRKQIELTSEVARKFGDVALTCNSDEKQILLERFEHFSLHTARQQGKNTEVYLSYKGRCQFGFLTATHKLNSVGMRSALLGDEHGNDSGAQIEAQNFMNDMFVNKCAQREDKQSCGYEVLDEISKNSLYLWFRTVRGDQLITNDILFFGERFFLSKVT